MQGAYMENNITQQLKDIKPLLEIPDSSYYIYWGMIAFISILLVGILFFVMKKLWENRKVNLAKGYVQALKNISWDESKKAAYQATHYARLLATDDRKKELFSQLEPLLEQYKYKKEVAAMDDETLKYFNLYVQVSDESL